MKVFCGKIMKNHEIEKIEKEILQKYKKADKKTTKRMVVDSASVKSLARVIKGRNK